MAGTQGDALLVVDSLEVSFRAPGTAPLHAVRGISFAIERGECVVILGESGSGKSVTAQALLGLHDPRVATVTAGSLTFAGRPLFGPEGKLGELRGRRMSMVFQDALSALNPVHRVGAQIAEMFRAHTGMRRREAHERAVALMRDLQIPDPERRARSFPHELSGGMRQRIVIAMALALQPELLIADEPTTALDVTVQSQIIQLLRARQRATGMAMLMITHDVGVAAEVADRIVVMYAGSIVETGTAEQVLLDPRHPYTAGLIASAPRADQARLPEPIAGGLPDPREPMPGCAFAPRCRFAVDSCWSIRPPLLRDGGTGREVSCHVVDAGNGALL